MERKSAGAAQGVFGHLRPRVLAGCRFVFESELSVLIHRHLARHGRNLCYLLGHDLPRHVEGARQEHPHEQKADATVVSALAR